MEPFFKHFTNVFVKDLHSLATELYNGLLAFQEELTSTAKSAWDAPPIMLGTKLLWPGASRIVKCFFSVSK